MGCGSSSAAGASAAGDPKVGMDVFLPQNSAIGKVLSVDTERREIKISEIGTSKEETYKYADYKGKQKWKPVAAEPTLAPFAPSFQVTANFRGADVNGFIIGVKEDLLEVHFRPDEAHAVDKTNWKLGTTEKYKSSDLKPGHNGAERPRNRTPEEIKQDGDKVKSYGVSYIYCGTCGQGVWENPCACYTAGEKKGIFCQQCGKQASKSNEVCCGDAVSNGAQNQGYPAVLSSQ